MYKGQDVTLDILTQTEKVVRLISDKQGRSFDDCLLDFTASRTYKALQNPMSVMWAESAQFITDEYFRELQENEKQDS